MADHETDSTNAVQTEGTNLAMVVETALGAKVPPITGWFNLDPNSYGQFGSTYRKEARDPITKSMQKQKGMLIDEDSGLSIELDVTMDNVDRFAEGIYRSVTKHSGGTGMSRWWPSAVTGAHYAVDALGALAQRMLVVGLGFNKAANNGLKMVGAGATGNTIPVPGLDAEAAPPSNAILCLAGRRGAASDLELDADGNLICTADDFTTWGLNEFQCIYLGGEDAVNQFATAEYYGAARIAAGGIAAKKLTFDKRSWAVGAADDGDAKQIDVYFSRFWRNVAMGHADFRRPSFAFEVMYPDLDGGDPMFEYLLGNMVNNWTWNIPLTTKATINVDFVGTRTLPITEVRKAGPVDAKDPVGVLGVSTATDLARLRVADVDDLGIATDFVSMKLGASNAISGEKQLARLGARIMNQGKHTETFEADVIFTDPDVIRAVRDNRTVSTDCLMRNRDFGVMIDIHAMTLDSADRKLEKDKVVKVGSKGTGFQHDVSGSTGALSMFAYLPPQREE